MKAEERDDRARDQARAQLRGIVETMSALAKLQDGAKTVSLDGDVVDEDQLRERILEDPLCVEVRSDWHQPGDEDQGPSEYRILLCTGGPAVQICGDLNEHSEPETAVLEFQDWFQPWEPYTDTSDDEDEALLEYARQFYYDEGR